MFREKGRISITKFTDEGCTVSVYEDQMSMLRIELSPVCLGKYATPERMEMLNKVKVMLDRMIRDEQELMDSGL